MIRDKEEYSDYFSLASLSDKVEYSMSLNVEVKKNDVLIFDEADYFIYKYPCLFEKLTANQNVICFTATTPDSDLQELEHRVLQRQKFKLYNYAPEALCLAKRLVPDRTIEPLTGCLLITFLETITHEQPVLVYTTKERADMILNKIVDAFQVTVESKADLLTGLDERTQSGKYQVLVFTDPLVARGTNFRAKGTGFTMLCERGTESELESQQLLARCGRFGERC